MVTNTFKKAIFEEKNTYINIQGNIMTKFILNLYTNLHKTRSKSFIHKALQEALENNSQKVLSTDASCISSFKSLLSKSMVPITSSEKTTPQQTAQQNI